MTAQLAPVPVAKFFSNDGFPLSFGRLFTYAAGTTTPQATYVDSTQTTQNTNPIVFNFRGECNLWLDPTKTYKFLLQDIFGNTIPGWPVDNIPGSAFVSASGSLTIPSNLIPTPTNTLTLGNPSFSWAQIYLGPNSAPAFDTLTGNIGYYARTSAEISALVTPTDFGYPPGHWLRYGADPTGVLDATTAIQNALKVSSGAVSYGPKGTYKVTSTLLLKDNSELYCEPLCQINYTDTSGTFCMQIGASGVSSGQVIVRNLQIVLQTKTAGGIKLLNSKLSRLVNPYIQGYTAVIDTTRTNVGLQITGDTGIITFWNRIEDAYINNCHIAVQFPNTGVNQITKQYFVNFNAWGGAPQGDNTSIAFDIQSYNGAFSNIDQGYLDGFGTYFKLQGAVGWRSRAVVIDGESLTTATPVAVSFDATTGDCKFVEGFISSICKVLDASPLSSGNEYRGLMSSAKIGASFAGAPQNYSGLNDHTGQLGAQTLCMAGSIFVTISGGAIQTLQGACYVPSTGLIYAASKQGNLLWFDPTTYAEVRGSLNYTSTLSNTDRIPICYCPVNGFIYIANRADNKLVIVNPKTVSIVQQIDLTLTAGANCAPYGIAYCPFNNKIYVAENGTNNLSIITPTSNGTDSVAQTLAGFGISLLTVAYCPITQKMYVGGQNANLFIVTPTTNATDSLLQTLGLTGSNFYGIAYCHRNQKMYVSAGNVATLNIINPTTGGTDTVASTVTLTAQGNTSVASRSMVYDLTADAIVILGGNSRCAIIYPSSNGTADICTNVQITAGVGVDLVYHPNAGKVYECNASNLYEYA